MSVGPRRAWLGLATLTLPCVLYSMDLTVLNLAIPQLSADLHPSSTQLLWIIDIYGFLLAASLIPMGTLGDRIGRRKLLLIGAGLFGLVSTVTAFSTSAELLIACRALLGVAASTLAPSTLSMIRHMFHDLQRRRVAIAVWVSSFSTGAAIGPLLGGLLLERFWWGSVFLLAVPVMVILLLVGPILLPESRDPDVGRVDLLSAVLSLATTLSAIYGLKQIAQGGIGWHSLIAIVAGIVLGIAFVRRQLRLSDPLLDLRLFCNHTFSWALAINTLDFFVGFGMMLFISQYLQLVRGLSPMDAGLWMVPWAIGFIAGSLLTPAFARIARPAFVMAGGLVLAAVGFAVLARIDVSSSLAAFAVGCVVFSIGLAPMTTLATDMMVGGVPAERAGVAAAISETSSEFGGALGIAVLGSLGTAAYRSLLAKNLPAGLPPDAARIALDTLGGAAALATGLPDGVGTTILTAAREAFQWSFELASAVSAVILVVGAIMAGVFLKHVR